MMDAAAVFRCSIIVIKQDVHQACPCKEYLKKMITLKQFESRFPYTSGAHRYALPSIGFLIKVLNLYNLV